VYRHFVDRDLLINETPLSVFAAEAIFVTSLAEAESAILRARPPLHPGLPGYQQLRKIHTSGRLQHYLVFNRG
jgi:hypothetical protein